MNLDRNQGIIRTFEPSFKVFLDVVGMCEYFADDGRMGLAIRAEMRMNVSRKDIYVKGNHGQPVQENLPDPHARRCGNRHATR
jgi:hypothetical protein